MAIVAIIGMIIIFILVLVFFSAATLINFALSLLTFHILQKKINNFIALIITIFFSIALTFNVKIPEMIKDTSISKTIVKLSIPIEYKKGEKISISGKSSVSFRNTLYSITELGVGGTCSCLFRKDPKILTESVMASVLSMGLEVTSKEHARYHLGVYSTSEGNYDIIDMKLFDGSTLVFHKQLLARRYYKGESYMKDEHTKFSMGFILNYIFDNTIWQHIFNEKFSPEQDSLILHELNNIFITKIDNIKNEKLSAEIVEVNENRLTAIEPQEFKDNCTIGVSTGNDNHIYYLTIDGTTRSTNKNLEDALYFCDADSIYFLKLPEGYSNYFLFDRFDFRGNHLSSRHYEIPIKTWPKKPDQTLIHIKIKEHALFVGLDIEVGTYPNKQYLFKLPGIE